MPALAVLLVLVAAVCHSTWNVLLKNEPRRLEMQSGALAVAVLLASPVLFVYPVGAVSGEGWALVLLSALFETAYVFSLTAAYATGDLALVYPVARGTAPLVVAPLAIVIFGERLPASGVLGIVLVVAGIYASHVGAVRATSGPTEAPGGAQGRTALALAVLTGTMTAGYSLVNRAGVRTMPVLLYGVLVIGLNAVLVLIARGFQGGLRVSLRRDAPWGRIVVVALLMMTAYLAVLAAMTMAPVSYVVAARETSIVVTVALSALVLREPPSWPRVIGALATLAGLVVLALSR
jgi:drug/metabolite transporter (DMT)-like permease